MMNKQEDALRIMRALHKAGFNPVERRELDLTIARTLDLVDKRALRGWRFYLEARGYAVPVKRGASRYHLQFPVMIELEAFRMEEEGGESDGTDRQT